MNITQSEQNGVVVFTVDGRIDSDGAVKMEQTLMEAVSGGKSQMVLDMSEVRYINSAGLRILAEVLTANRENNGDLHLVGLNNKVRRVFQIIGFDNFFQIFEDTDSAAKAF